MDNKEKKFINQATIAVFSLLLLLAVFLPEDILSHSPMLQSISDVMSGLVPSIENLTRRSRFPEVTQLILSVTWLIIPILALAYYKIDMVRIDIVSKKRKLFLLVFLLLFPALIFSFGYILGNAVLEEANTIGDRVIQKIISSRLLISILASLITITLSFLLALFVQWIRIIPFIYFNRKTQLD